jgi:hypothetical protein
MHLFCFSALLSDIPRASPLEGISRMPPEKVCLPSFLKIVETRSSVAVLPNYGLNTMLVNLLSINYWLSRCFVILHVLSILPAFEVWGIKQIHT